MRGTVVGKRYSWEDQLGGSTEGEQAGDSAFGSQVAMGEMEGPWFGGTANSPADGMHVGFGGTEGQG